jgi:hypothetical protein
MCDKFGPQDQGNFLAWYRLHHWKCYFTARKEWDWTGGGCCPLQFWQAHAVKFKELLKVRRTLTELQTAFFKFVKKRESSRTRTFGQTSNWTTLPKPIWEQKKWWNSDKTLHFYTHATSLAKIWHKSSPPPFAPLTPISMIFCRNVTILYRYHYYLKCAFQERNINPPFLGGPGWPDWKNRVFALICFS